MLKECIIYWIHSESETDITTQGYVGITKNLKRRIREHTNEKDFVKDRIFDVFLCGERDFCKEIERQLRPKKNIGLNIAAGGGDPPNAKGLKRSEKTRRLMSLNNVGMKGMKHTEETRKKMRESHKNSKGRPHTEETKRKLSEIARRRKFNPMTGRKHTDLAKQKMSAAAKQRWTNTQTQE